MNDIESDIMPYFDDLVLRHKKLITSLCITCASGDEKLADILVQECLIDLFCYRHTLRPDTKRGEESAWVYWRCHHAISHYQRSLQTYNLLPIDKKLADTLPDSSPEYGELLDHLARNLTPIERQAFSLMAQGCSIKEMAEELDMKPSMVKKLRHLIIKKIRNDNPEYIRHENKH